MERGSQASAGEQRLYASWTPTDSELTNWDSLKKIYGTAGRKSAATVSWEIKLPNVNADKF